MQPAFTYSELQKRFCEGFNFLPLDGLQQSGSHIYKCYTKENNTPALLGRYDSYCESGSLHARVLLIKLIQKDIPMADQLLSKLKAEIAGLQMVFRQAGKEQVMSRHLLTTMNTYHSLLTAYWRQMQDAMGGQLSALCNK